MIKYKVQGPNPTNLQTWYSIAEENVPTTVRHWASMDKNVHGVNSPQTYLWNNLRWRATFESPPETKVPEPPTKYQRYNSASTYQCWEHDKNDNLGWHDSFPASESLQAFLDSLPVEEVRTHSQGVFHKTEDVIIGKTHWRRITRPEPEPTRIIYQRYNTFSGWLQDRPMSRALREVLDDQPMNETRYEINTKAISTEVQVGTVRWRRAEVLGHRET